MGPLDHVVFWWEGQEKKGKRRTEEEGNGEENKKRKKEWWNIQWRRQQRHPTPNTSKQMAHTVDKMWFQSIYLNLTAPFSPPTPPRTPTRGAHKDRREGSEKRWRDGRKKDGGWGGWEEGELFHSYIPLLQYSNIYILIWCTIMFNRFSRSNIFCHTFSTPGPYSSRSKHITRVFFPAPDGP